MAQADPTRSAPVEAPARPIRIDLPPPAGLVLRTPRMLLRALIPGDRDSFLAAAIATREQLDLHFPLHKNGESDEGMFVRQLELGAPAAGDQHTAAPWIRLVGLLSDGTIVGGFNINTIARGLECSADVNWWIGAPFAGRGLATEGVRAILRHALTDLPAGLGLQRVHAWVTRDNPASARVALKAGMRRAGEERSYLSTGGRWVLHDLYTKTVADELP